MCFLFLLLFFVLLFFLLFLFYFSGEVINIFKPTIFFKKHRKIPLKTLKTHFFNSGTHFFTKKVINILGKVINILSTFLTKLSTFWRDLRSPKGALYLGFFVFYLGDFFIYHTINTLLAPANRYFITLFLTLFVALVTPRHWIYLYEI